jgi:hypothetical protein
MLISDIINTNKYYTLIVVLLCIFVRGPSLIILTFIVYEAFYYLKNAEYREKQSKNKLVQLSIYMT